MRVDALSYHKVVNLSENKISYLEAAAHSKAAQQAVKQKQHAASSAACCSLFCISYSLLRISSSLALCSGEINGTAAG